MIRAHAIASLASTLAASLAAGQSFTLVPGALGTGTTQVRGITADGATVVGSSSGTGPGQGRAFRWSAGVREDVGFSPDMPPVNNGLAISGTGQTIAGNWANTGSTHYEAYRWSGPGTFRAIGVLPGYDNSTPTGVTDTGLVVGNSTTQDGIHSRAFWWTESGGLQAIPFTRPGHVSNTAQAISRNGSVVVGSSFGGSLDAYVWTDDGGIRILPTLIPTGIDAEGIASGVNHDGSIIVGWSDGPTATHGIQAHAVIWQNNQLLDLGVPSGYIRSRLTAVNDLGTIAIGAMQPEAPGNEVPTIWTASRGLERFVDYLAASGVSVPGNVNIYQLSGISADGLTICGYTGFDGVNQGFVVTIPGPVPLGLFMFSFVAPRRRR